MDLRTLMSRCLGFVLGKRMDSDLDDELRSHVDFAVEENLGRGMPEAEARREALRNVDCRLWKCWRRTFVMLCGSCGSRRGLQSRLW